MIQEKEMPKFGPGYAPAICQFQRGGRSSSQQSLVLNELHTGDGNAQMFQGVCIFGPPRGRPPNKGMVPG